MSAGSDFLRRLVGHAGGVAGLIMIAVVLVPAMLAPVLPLPDPTLTEPARRMLPPLAPGHLLGTDQLGRDLLSRLIWGARSSILVGALATLLAAVGGSLIGILAGFFGRPTDAVLMRGIDVLMAFPYLLLALAIVAALGPGLEHAMLAISVANLPFFARAVRGAVLEIRHQDYIDAARLAGHGRARIIVREVIPNLAPTILLLMTTTLGWMVLETAGLSFLGLGAQPPQADLGSMLGEGRELLTTYPLVAVLPGLVILLLVAGINLLGDALRDLLDPRLVAGVSSSADAATRGSEKDRRASEKTAPARRTERGMLALDAVSVRVPSAQGLVDAVSSVSFNIASGERVGLVGESGSGKSLTALALLRLTPPGARLGGAIWLHDSDLLQLEERALRRVRGRLVGYVPQDPFAALDPLFRVGDQIAEALRAHGVVRVEARVGELIRLVGLSSVAGIRKRFPHELSGGQCQRVAIALALAHEPDLLIADEATTALDVRVQAEVLALLKDLSEGRDRALLFVSHDLALVAGLCERVVVLYAGRVLEDAPLRQILDAPAHPYTVALLACSPELGRPGKRLPAVPGQPPTPAEATLGMTGCRFEPRCPKARAVCAEAEPVLDEIRGGHFARCLFPEHAPT